MVKFLVNLDNQLFFLINQHGHHPWTDFLAKFLVDWPIFLIILLFLYSERHRRTSLLLLSTLFLAVMVNSLILKNIFQRSRPYWIFPEAIRLSDGSFFWQESWRPPFTSWAFPSSHTVLAGAVAYVSFLRHRKLRWTVAILTFLSCFARVFTGNHRPLDVLTGVFVGIVVGIFSLSLFNFLPKGKNGYSSRNK